MEWSSLGMGGGGLRRGFLCSSWRESNFIDDFSIERVFYHSSSLESATRRRICAKSLDFYFGMDWAIRWT